MRVRMAKMSPELQSYADDGLRLCRNGDWNKGLSVLASVLDQRSPLDQVPGVVYSFLGYGVARFQGKLREGLKLCEHSLKIEYYEADNHWNLARVQALAGERQNAHQTIDHGLKLNPEHEGLLATQKELGVRKQPVLGFLSRDNPVNVFLGRLRHSMKASNDSTQPPARPALRHPTSATGTRTPRPSGAPPARSATARESASKSPAAK